jgi:hypothetical protein
MLEEPGASEFANAFKCTGLFEEMCGSGDDLEPHVPRTQMMERFTV